MTPQDKREIIKAIEDLPVNFSPWMPDAPDIDDIERKLDRVIELLETISAKLDR